MEAENAGGILFILVIKLAEALYILYISQKIARFTGPSLFYLYKKPFPEVASLWMCMGIEVES